MAVLPYVYAYLLGGVTLLPLVLVAWYLLLPAAKPYDDSPEYLQAGEIEEGGKSGLNAYKSGWITVTQEYIESLDDISAATQSISETTDNKSAYTTLYKLSKDSEDKTEPIDAESIAAAKEDVKSNHKKHRFYAVLKHGNLFLYKNNSLKDVKHVIVLSNQLVTIWPRNLTDAQLFTKRSAVCLMKRDWCRSRRTSEDFPRDKLTVNDVLDPSNNLSPPKSSFFIYCDTNIQKEDWYFALIRASKRDDDMSSISCNLYAKSLHFDTNEIMDLIQTLYSSEGQLQTKWMNALIGRLFLSLKRTEVVHHFFESRITKKLDKVKLPGFLDKFKLDKLQVGNSCPFFTFPDLKEINPNGTLIFTAYLHYHGNLSCNISTKVNLNLGTFSQTQVDVTVNVTLQKLEGPVIFKIKPPPSGRLWYSFEIEPLISLKIEPVISSRQMSYTIITNAIEKRFKEAIKESLVLPHWDDISFYNTEDELFRGGIWDKSVRPLEMSFDDKSSSDKSDISDTIPSKANVSSSAARLKLTNTLTDLSKRMKKAKSSHTVEINGENWLSDGSISEKTSSTDSSNLNTAKASIGKTWRKLGDWYSSGNDKSMEYQKPEMILNRRRPRTASEVDGQEVSEPSSPASTVQSYEMFSKSVDFGLINHSRKNSRLSDNFGGSLRDYSLKEAPEEPEIPPTANLSSENNSSEPPHEHPADNHVNSKLHRKPPSPL